jgi:hypothetical protein
MIGKGASGRDVPITGEWIEMRATKVLMVTLTMTASLIVGVAGSANAAPAQSGPGISRTLWCC